MRVTRSHQSRVELEAVGQLFQLLQGVVPGSRRRASLVTVVVGVTATAAAIGIARRSLAAAAATTTTDVHVGLVALPAAAAGGVGDGEYPRGRRGGAVGREHGGNPGMEVLLLEVLHVTGGRGHLRLRLHVVRGLTAVEPVHVLEVLLLLLLVVVSGSRGLRRLCSGRRPVGPRGPRRGTLLRLRLLLLLGLVLGSGSGAGREGSRPRRAGAGQGDRAGPRRRGVGVGRAGRRLHRDGVRAGHGHGVRAGLRAVHRPARVLLLRARLGVRGGHVVLTVRTLTREAAVGLLLLLLLLRVCALWRLCRQVRDRGLHGGHVGRRLAGLLRCHGLLMGLLLLLLLLDLLLLLLLHIVRHLMLWCCVLLLLLLLLLLHGLIHHAAISHVHVHTANAVGRLHDVASHLVAVAGSVAADVA